MYQVLLIEDDPIMWFLIGDILRKSGYNLETCGDGAQALETARKVKPDLILLDVHLPNLNGIEVCRQLKRDGLLCKIPVIMISGDYREVDHRIEGLSVGADDYVLKPFSPEVLLARIRRLLPKPKTPSLS